MRKVYQARNPADAHLLKGVLETQNIEAVVQGDFLWGTRGETPITPETSPSVWVIDETDYQRALDIMQEFQCQDLSNDSMKEWKCQKCGESNEGQFSECWNCGAEQQWEKQE